MEWTHEQYERIKHLLPVQRGNVEIENLTFLQSLQYMVENGCRWRALPEHFGKWNSIYGEFSMDPVVIRKEHYQAIDRTHVLIPALLFPANKI